MKWKYSVGLLLFLLIFMTGCSSSDEKETKNTEAPQQTTEDNRKFETVAASPKQLEQLQGIGYPGNDDGLYIASTDGLKIYRDNKWFENTAENHNYYGFSAVSDGFYTSGMKANASKDNHAALGVSKSTDKGATIQPVSLSGKEAFQFLSAGYKTETLYLIQQEDSNELAQGVYISNDGGKSWDPLALNGMDANTLGMIAPHPEDNEIMAMATRSGIYLSEDSGESMELISDPVMVTALAFSNNTLFYSSVENEKIKLNKLDLESRKIEEIDIPFLKYDNPITFITVNQNSEQTVAFSTYLSDVYETTDLGESWSLLLSNGRIE